MSFISYLAEQRQIETDPNELSTAGCGAEDISSRAGLSSRASTKTYERVHTRCAEINELSGRNYGV